MTNEPSAAAVVEVDGLSVTYGGRHPVIDGVDLSVRQGEFVAIAGPNGGGKTTLLRAILGLAPIASGTVRLFGDDLGSFRRRELVGYLRQRPQPTIESPVTVEEVLLSGLVGRGSWLGRTRRDDRARALAALDRVGLTDRLRSQLRHLSGGQQQRVLLARMLAGDPKLVLLDEPTTGVDAASQVQFAQLLWRAQRDLGVTIVYVSHEFGAVEAHVDRIAIVNGGIVFDGRPDQLDASWHDPSHDHAAAHAHRHGADAGGDA